jgi:hypothetical protein
MWISPWMFDRSNHTGAAAMGAAQAATPGTGEPSAELTDTGDRRL